MIKIYCLVDPLTNKPFYVGATKVKLSSRLSAHIHEALVFKTNEYAIRFTSYKKHFLIKDLVNAGHKPLIHLLYTCPLFSVEHYEMFFYELLINQGFELFNWKHNFNYLKYTKVSYYNFNKNT